MKKILVANRGEIALRVMRACKEMGISTVAVYSEADVDSRHRFYADEAVCIGPAASSESYLRGDKIIEVALNKGAEGIHPGYGFLSENPVFARAVKEAGIIFIGPSAESMEMMGSKIGAKQAVKKYAVPLVPGTDEAIDNIEEAQKIATNIGFPVLLKASAGGGGKGMRIVNFAEEFEEQYHRARNEAISAFGDGAVFIEKYVGRPRHIEFQIMADNYGNVVHLFERECSVQRRHQKLVEEAPSALLTKELRQSMGEAAVNAAQACQYSGAGTIEFLMDGQNYYFLEMNTRLQVEHPVTEMITGLDLVKEQIRIARGEKLGYSQKDLEIHGHSIELRVCAEDPANQFLPDIGKLNRYKIPNGDGIRVDDGFQEGQTIPIHYDPMIAKLIVHAEDRPKAIEKMKQAIYQYRISGIETTLGFGLFTMNHEAFNKGEFDTRFIEDYFTPEGLFAQEENLNRLGGFLAAFLHGFPDQDEPSDWFPSKTDSNWRNNRSMLR